MPFDSLPQNQDKIEIYKKRRDEAIKIWKQIPKDKFTIRSFFDNCGSTACAIGWLALYHHDGWYTTCYSIPRHTYITGSIEDTTQDPVISIVSEYFGITFQESLDIFCNPYHSYGKPLSLITLEDVIKKLEATSITVHA